MSRDIQLTGIQNTHLEEPLEELHQLVADLEATIEKGSGDPTLAPINERLDELEAAIDAIDQGDSLDSGDVRKRLADLGALVDEHGEELEAITDELGEIRTLVSDLESVIEEIDENERIGENPTLVDVHTLCDPESGHVIQAIHDHYHDREPNDRNHVYVLAGDEWTVSSGCTDAVWNETVPRSTAAFTTRSRSGSSSTATSASSRTASST